MRLHPRLVSVPGAIVGWMLLYACSGADAPEAVVLHPIATTEPVPLSATHSIALVDRERVCLIDSYMVQVLCGDRRWRDPVAYGSEGEGPGEYSAPAVLVRGAAGTLGVSDYRLARFTVFDGAGRVAKTAQVPPLFNPLGPFTDSLVVGSSSTSPTSRRTQRCTGIL